MKKPHQLRAFGVFNPPPLCLTVVLNNALADYSEVFDLADLEGYGSLEIQL